MKTFSVQQVAEHNKESDSWIVVDGRVFDVTKFQSEHPGGKKVLLKVAGSDASKQFWQFHNKAILEKYAERLQVGVIGEQSVVSHSDVSKVDALFGEGIPNGDPDWYQGLPSPYYKESHAIVRQAVRQFVETHIMPYTHEWDESGQTVPKEVFKKCGQAGILTAVLGPPWPTKLVPHIQPPGGIPAQEFDNFHEFIVFDELSRAASAGTLWGLFGGHAISIPCITAFASDALKQKVIPPCLTGDAICCLAITEPSGGSDVANLKTEARKTDDGKFYIVNGEKKWITNGIYADFFVVAVRTGGKGMGGLSLLLLEKGMPGLKTRKMKCSGAWSSGTTYITFEDVKVPVENLIGKENQGFICIMYNFNHERLGIAFQATRFARVCLEDATRYAMKREAFGKPLIEQPVVRKRIADMSRRIEASHAWIESVVYQFQKLPKKVAQTRLSGQCALLKAHAAEVFDYCARSAAQIFGGLAFSRGGQGERVERLYREVLAYLIPGGSYDVMLDLSVRQNIKIAEDLQKSKL